MNTFSGGIVNIWSHLLGAIYFLAVLLHHSALQLQASHHHKTATTTTTTTQDTLALQLYHASVATCFLLSALFHTFSDHSPATHKRLNELDHLGIVLVLWGAGISTTHFTFYCDPPVRQTYQTAMTIAAVSCGVLTTARAEFRHRTLLRVAVFGVFDALTFVPAMHGLWRYGGEPMERMMGLRSFVALAVINFPGVAMYVTRTPERWFPGRFDILGQSHHWMHVLVVVAVVVRLRGLLRVVEFWEAYTRQYGYCYGFPVA